MSERFMGEFDPKATYKKGDVVTLNGEAYRRVRDDGGKVDPFQTMPYRVWQKKSAASGGLVNLLGGPGGGGGTSDAVQYIPQELTESQQMQARKNLGLYYSEVGKGQEAMRETTFEAREEYPGTILGDIGNFPMDVGEKFVVVFDGVEYVLESRVMNESIAIGSQFDMTAGVPLWDVPFAVGYVPAYGVTSCMLQTAGTHVMSIYTLEEIARPIPAKFLEPERTYAITQDDTNEFACELDFNTAYSISPETLRKTITFRATTANPVICQKINAATGQYIMLLFRGLSMDRNGFVVSDDVYLKWTSEGITQVSMAG